MQIFFFFPLEIASLSDPSQNTDTRAEPFVAKIVVTNSEGINVKEIVSESEESLNLPTLSELEQTCLPEDGRKEVIKLLVENMAESEVKMQLEVSQENNFETQPLEEDLKGKIVAKENEEVEVEEESSVDSVSRPQNLPLNGEGDQPKRKIDLIGECDLNVAFCL